MKNTQFSYPISALKFAWFSVQILTTNNITSSLSSSFACFFASKSGWRKLHRHVWAEGVTRVDWVCTNLEAKVHFDASQSLRRNNVRISLLTQNSTQISSVCQLTKHSTNVTHFLFFAPATFFVKVIYPTSLINLLIVQQKVIAISRLHLDSGKW